MVSGWAVGLAADGLVAYAFYRSVTAFWCLLPFALAYPLYLKKQLHQKRQQELKRQFKEGIQILSSSLSAGYSMENALAVSGKELQLLYGEQEMITREFAYMVSQLNMNRPVEQLMSEFGERSGIEEIENFAGIFAVAKRSGGQLVPVIQNSVNVIQDRLQVQEEIRTLTASRKFEQKIMNLIPFFIILYIDGTSPGFFQMMYDTVMGRVLMTVCLLVYGLAWYLSKQILEISM